MAASPIVRSYGWRHVRSASPVPATNASFAARPSRHVTSCMFIAAASASRSRLLSTSNCSTNAGEELAARLPLPGADEDGAADLVEHGRRALLVRRVDDVGLQRIDRRQLLLAPVEAKRAGVVACRRSRWRRPGSGWRDGSRITRRAAGREPAEQRLGAHDRMTHRQIRRPGGSPKIRASLIACAKRKSPIRCGAPTRRVRHARTCRDP